MRPTEILKNEHRVIEQVLTCLERMVARALAEGKLPREHAADALKFFREFADGCHHKKEEERLFPALEARGMPKHTGPTEAMRLEHEQGRTLIRSMMHELNAAANGQRDALKVFAHSAAAYIRMLREHIHKEDHCLFSMADDLLTAGDQEHLEADFETVEREQVKPCCHEHCLAIAANLGQQYGVPAPTPMVPVAHAHCCGNH